MCKLKQHKSLSKQLRYLSDFPLNYTYFFLNIRLNIQHLYNILRTNNYSQTPKLTKTVPVFKPVKFVNNLLIIYNTLFPNFPSR